MTELKPGKRLYDVAYRKSTLAYIEGKPLGEFAVSRTLLPRQSAALVRKLALALQEAHKCGVIHRP